MTLLYWIIKISEIKGKHIFVQKTSERFHIEVSDQNITRPNSLFVSLCLGNTTMHSDDVT